MSFRKDSNEISEQAAGIGALADQTRLALYEYVVRQDVPVGREQAAAALELPPHTARFHLDRLVDEGLLEVEFKRLSGKSGPGAGRPSKLYKRAAKEFSVSLPGRRYDLAGHILAEGIATASDHLPLQQSLDNAARREGRSYAEQSGIRASDLTSLGDVLEGLGYEPRIDGDDLVLENCPFDALAKEHTEMICGVNCCYVQGVIDGLGADKIEARLDPEPGRCCVKARLRA